MWHELVVVSVSLAGSFAEPVHCNVNFLRGRQVLILFAEVLMSLDPVEVDMERKEGNNGLVHSQQIIVGRVVKADATLGNKRCLVPMLSSGIIYVQGDSWTCSRDGVAE